VIRVLVVDDHALMRTGIAATLARTDDITVVGEAADGDEAVAAVADVEPDVVLMDLAMPTMDGAAATARIVAAHPGVHVLILTSFGDRDRIVDALAAGAEGYLLKDAGPDTLVDGIREVVRGGAPLDPRAARVVLTDRLAPRPPALTARELEVLAMVGGGQPNRHIATELGISERTVKAHLGKIYQRLGVRDRTQAALWAQRHFGASG
jgi:DNA-binding NarL/FixJ family response regulator